MLHVAKVSPLLARILQLLLVGILVLFTYLSHESIIMFLECINVLNFFSNYLIQGLDYFIS